MSLNKKKVAKLLIYGKTASKEWQTCQKSVKPTKLFQTCQSVANLQVWKKSQKCGKLNKVWQTCQKYGKPTKVRQTYRKGLFRGCVCPSLPPVPRPCPWQGYRGSGRRTNWINEPFPSETKNKLNLFSTKAFLAQNLG